MSAIKKHIARNWTWYVGLALSILAICSVIFFNEQNSVLAILGCVSLIICGGFFSAFCDHYYKPKKNKLTFWRVFLWGCCLPGILTMFYVYPMAPGIYRYHDGTEVFFPIDQESMIVLPFSGKFHGISNPHTVTFTSNPDSLITQKLYVLVTPAPSMREQIRRATKLDDDEFKSKMKSVLATAVATKPEQCLYPHTEEDINACLSAMVAIARRSVEFPVECSNYSLKTSIEEAEED